MQEHVAAAAISYIILLLTNLVAIFGKSYFYESKLFFPVIILGNIIMISLLYSNFKNREYRGEGIIYMVLFSLLIVSLLGGFCFLHFKSCSIINILVELLNESFLKKEIEQ